MTDEEMDSRIAKYNALPKLIMVIDTSNPKVINVTGPFKTRKLAEESALSDGKYSGKENVFVLDANTEGGMVTHGTVSIGELERRGRLTP